MKRSSGNVENNESGVKKVKFFDENFVDLDKNEGEGERVLAENGSVDYAQVDGNGNLLGDVVPDNFDGPSLGGVGGVEGSNKWDFDINFDQIFGNEEEQKGLAFDLNFPVYSKYPNRWKKGLLESDQYPDRRGKEVVDLVSDDGESDVEIIGYTRGYNSKDKQMEPAMPCDRVGNLSLGLGLLRMDNGDGERNLMTSGEGRYTREEKGKASDMDSWLSLKTNYSVDLVLDSDSDESIQSIEPPADVEVIPRQPAPVVMSEMVERMKLAEKVYRRNTARQLARMNFSDQNSGNQSSSQRQQPPTPNPIIEQLGILPGPFSDALKMVRERASKGAAQQLIEWTLVKNQERNITAAFVPSLLDLSLKALARSAEGIVSLGQVPDRLRGRLTNILCDIGNMNACFLNLLLDGCPTEIRIKNCAWLTEEQFQQTIGKCQTRDLRVLQLDLCGQCLLDIAIRSILDRCSSSFSRLAIVSLRGACRLTDNGLRVLIVSAPLLRSINLGHCTLLTSDAVNFIADLLGSDLRELYIDECHKIHAMQILPAFKKFSYLEVLSVAGIHTINDQFVSEVVTACGQSLKELDFADCLQLTDYSLKAIGESCADLCSLNISNLNNLTDLGLEYLANGCRSIHTLKLRRHEFSDEAVAAFLESSGESLLELLLNNIAKVGPLTALSLAKRSRKLSSLDISWCRRISNEALGLIVDSCSSLKLLKIFGCRQITNEFLKGHSNQLVRIIGSNFTPILDHLDLLEPEEMFLRYSPLPDYMEE